MAKIVYNISGTYPPFGVELRENNIGGAIIANDTINDVKENIGTYEVDNVQNGTYVIVVYDNAGGFDVSPAIVITDATTTTTTSSTTIPPNPKLYVALRRANGTENTNTNATYPNPVNDLYIFITTDPINSQYPSTQPQQLFTPVNISINITGANNGHRVTGVGGINGAPQNVLSSGSWSTTINQTGIILPAGFRYGYIQIGARSTSIIPDDFTVNVSSSNKPFALQSDSEYQVDNSFLYGYDSISIGSVIMTQAVEGNTSESE